MEKIFSKAHEPWLLLHIIHRIEDIVDKRNDLVPANEFIQLASLKLSAGDTFRPHKHIPKSPFKFSTITQETWIVIKGKVKCILYDIDNTIIAERILNPGDCSITLNGGHNYEALEEGTIVYEGKTGPYEGILIDKRFI